MPIAQVKSTFFNSNAYLQLVGENVWNIIEIGSRSSTAYWMAIVNSKAGGWTSRKIISSFDLVSKTLS